MLEIKVAAQEEVRLGVVRGRGSEGLQGWGAIVRGGVQGPYGEPQSVWLTSLYNIHLQESPRENLAALEGNPRMGDKNCDSALWSTPRATCRGGGKNPCAGK